MENKISSNYLLNKYSYCIFFLISYCSYKIILKQYKLDAFIFFEVFILIAYIFWLFTTGSYHFLSQVIVFRQNQTTLKIKKFSRSILLTNNDIDLVNFYPIIFMKGNKVTIKIKITIYTKEEFFFQIKVSKDNLDISKMFDISYFYLLTSNFWGVVDKEKIRLASSIFSS